MRAVLRVLAPLLGIVLATVGVLVVIEVVAAWVLPEQEGGLLVPWPEWGAVLAGLSWSDRAQTDQRHAECAPTASRAVGERALCMRE